MGKVSLGRGLQPGFLSVQFDFVLYRWTARGQAGEGRLSAC